MKCFLYYIIVTVFFSGCGGGGAENRVVDGNGVVDDPEVINSITSKERSINDVKVNAQAVRDFFYRNGGFSVSSRKLQKKRVTETTKINCDTGYIKQTKFTETEYEKYDYNYEHTILNKAFFDCLNDPEPYGYITGFDLNNDTYNGAIENTYTATTRDHPNTNTHDKNTWSHVTTYNNFSIKHKDKSNSRDYGMDLNGVTDIRLNIEFDNEIDTIVMKGGFSADIEWKNMDKDISFIIEKYEVTPNVKFFEIIGNDHTGIHWTKLDIVNKGEMILTNPEIGEHKKGNLKMTINTKSIVVKQACSNQYEVKTIVPFETLADQNNPSTGEMTIYNNTNDILTKLLVIDEGKVELSSDFDNDGAIDYVENITWDNVLNTPNSKNICR